MTDAVENKPEMLDINQQPNFATEVNINIHFGKHIQKLNPQKDITPYESVRISELLSFMMVARMTPDVVPNFILEHGLSRHFTKVEMPTEGKVEEKGAQEKPTETKSAEEHF